MLVRLTPGDPIRAYLGETATDEQVAFYRAHLGLDQPLPIQYLRWLGNMLVGSWGTSYVSNRPVAELIRWNALRGEFGATDPEEQIRKRIDHMRAGTRYVIQRQRHNGRVYEMRGQPMPDGGYVTTYTDLPYLVKLDEVASPGPRCSRTSAGSQAGSRARRRALPSAERTTMKCQFCRWYAEGARVASRTSSSKTASGTVAPGR